MSVERDGREDRESRKERVRNRKRERCGGWGGIKENREQNLNIEC